LHKFAYFDAPSRSRFFAENTARNPERKRGADDAYSCNEPAVAVRRAHHGNLDALIA
jgi:hypothetical protein